MRIPKSFKIGGHTIKVKENNIAEEGDWGRFIFSRLAIDIEKNAPKSLKGEIFCHEVIEVINAALELGLEHKVIQQMGLALHQILSTQKGRMK